MLTKNGPKRRPVGLPLYGWWPTHSPLEQSEEGARHVSGDERRTDDVPRPIRRPRTTWRFDREATPVGIYEAGVNVDGQTSPAEPGVDDQQNRPEGAPGATSRVPDERVATPAVFLYLQPVCLAVGHCRTPWGCRFDWRRAFAKRRGHHLVVAR